LQKLFQLYGYTASTLSIGWPNGTPSGSTFTHVQDYAVTTYNSQVYRVVNDAVNNFSYTWASNSWSDSTSTPIDYHDMVWLLAQKLDARIHTPSDNDHANPAAFTVGFKSDQSQASVFASASVDPSNYTSADTATAWVYSSPRTVEQMNDLGALT